MFFIFMSKLSNINWFVSHLSIFCHCNFGSNAVVLCGKLIDTTVQDAARRPHCINWKFCRMATFKK